MEFKDILKAARVRAGLKQSEVAERVGLSTGAVSTYENGTRKPKIEVLIKLADEFDLPLDQLVGRKKTPGHTFPEIEVADFEEQRLLQMFREISSDDQQKVLAIVMMFHDMGKHSKAKQKQSEANDFRSEKNPASAG